jgi:hypothetical protein
MNSEEIQEKLNTPEEVFSSVKDGEVMFYLVYPLSRLHVLTAYAAELSKVFKEADNVVEINREQAGLKYNLSISSSNFSPALFFKELPCLTSCYDDLLEVIRAGAEVKLGFYFYRNPMERATGTEANANGSDNDQSIAEAPVNFANIAVFIEGSFEVKSDEALRGEAEFADLKPGTALYFAAQAQEAAKKNDDKK